MPKWVSLGAKIVPNECFWEPNRGHEVDIYFSQFGIPFCYPLGGPCGTLWDPLWGAGHSRAGVSGGSEQLFSGILLTGFRDIFEQAFRDIFELAFRDMFEQVFRDMSEQDIQDIF